MSDWWYALIFIAACAGVWGSLLWLIYRVATRRPTMSDPVVCTHRWAASNHGPCQCQRWHNHKGPHRCCCGNEADDE